MSREKIGELTVSQRSKLLSILGKNTSLTLVRFGKHIYQVVKSPEPGKDVYQMLATNDAHRAFTGFLNPEHVANIGRREVWYENQSDAHYTEIVKAAYQKAIE